MLRPEVPDTAEIDAGGMAAIVDRHEYDVDLSSGLPRPACACGWKAEREWSGTEVHSQHVEAVLREAGYGLMAEAWDEGYRLDWTGGVKWHNPYRGAADPCIAPPGNLCTDTGCWDADRCVVASVTPPASTDARS